MAETEYADRELVSDPAREFFDKAYESFRERCGGRPESTQFVLPGGNVRIDTGTASLTPVLTRALQHLKTSGAEEFDLAISAWDTPDTAMISPAWNESDYGVRGEILGFNDDVFRTAFDHGTAAPSMLDLEQGRAIFWTRDAAQLPAYENAAPVRTIFSWWLQARGCLLVHAAAVARGNACVLLAGSGGSGKSSAALICLLKGWDYLGDDYCAVNIGDIPRVFSLYSSIKIDREWMNAVPQFGQMAATIGSIHDGKKIMFLHEYWPERMRRVADCRLILLPCVTKGTRSSTSEASPAEALRALAPSSMFQTAAEGAYMFEQLANLVRRVPARWLNLGPDIEAIPGVVADCVDKVSQ